MPRLSVLRLPVLRLPVLRMIVAAAALSLAGPLPAVRAAALSWTDWADLALESPVVLTGTVTRVDRLSRRDAPDVPEGEVRAQVQVDLRSALKAPEILPQSAAWIWQGPADFRKRPPFAKGDMVFAFGVPVPGSNKPEVQAMRLLSRNGQQPWSEADDGTVRAILRAALQPGMANLMATGVRDAFHSEGDLPGARESQFFLNTKENSPLVLVVRRRGGASEPQILATAGEFVDQARLVEKDTLIWRALACGLPPRLPERLAGDPPLAEDYFVARLVIGACGRTLAGEDAPGPGASGTGSPAP